MEKLDIKLFLNQNYTYYQKLSIVDQLKFVDRVYEFIQEKTFVGRQDLIVTDFMQILIASSAVQLTLGLDTWNLSYFKDIVVYPSEYQNPQTKKFHKGETNLAGFVCFSWKDFLKGNENPHDKINLGIHEFGHALRFNGVRGNKTDYFFENYFPRWATCAYKEYNDIRSNKKSNSIFRKYGAVNINEFFSVSIETFFETPEEFKSYFPELYLHTSILLNQHVDDLGNIVIGCRNDLLMNTVNTLTKDCSTLFKHKLHFNGSTIVAICFGLLALFFLNNGINIVSYVCFFNAALFWLRVERQYTRISFEKNQLSIKKGYLFLKGYKKVVIPLTQFISFTGTQRNKATTFSNSNQLINHSSIHYYYYNRFYKESLFYIVDEIKFEELCAELRKNFIHVFIKKSNQDNDINDALDIFRF